MTHFDANTSEAYEMYHLLLGFCTKYEMYGAVQKARFKIFLSAAFGPNDRALEVVIGQFIAQLDHINDA